MEYQDSPLVIFLSIFDIMECRDFKYSIGVYMCHFSFQEELVFPYKLELDRLTKSSKVIQKGHILAIHHKQPKSHMSTTYAVVKLADSLKIKWNKNIKDLRLASNILQISWKKLKIWKNNVAVSREFWVRPSISRLLNQIHVETTLLNHLPQN